MDRLEDAKRGLPVYNQGRGKSGLFVQTITTLDCHKLEVIYDPSEKVHYIATPGHWQTKKPKQTDVVSE